MEEKNISSTRIGCVIYSLIIVLIMYGIVLPIEMLKCDLPILAFVFFFGTILCICAFFLANHIYKKNNHKKWISKIASGNWEFPIDDFYNKCKKENATKVSDAVCVKKMMLIAKDIILRAGVSEKYLPLYYDEEKVKNYYRTAKERELSENKKAKELEEFKKVTPQPTQLIEEEKEYISLQKKLKNLYLSEKRKAYLEFLIKNLKQDISSLDKGMHTLMSVPINMKASVEKEKNDWAIHGGLAQGIAGPAAGAVVASQKMAEYERNKANAEKASNDFINNTIAPMHSKYIEKVSDLQKELEFYEEKLQKLPTKLYFEEFDTEKLYKNLKITSSVSSKNKESISVSINITNKFHPVLSDQYSYATDGILRVKLFCDDTTDVLVDDFYVALPENGVPCGGDAGVYYYPEKYMIPIDKKTKTRKYRCEISPHKLWIMEQ